PKQSTRRAAPTRPSPRANASASSAKPKTSVRAIRQIAPPRNSPAPPHPRRRKRRWKMEDGRWRKTSHQPPRHPPSSILHPRLPPRHPPSSTLHSPLPPSPSTPPSPPTPPTSPSPPRPRAPPP